MHTGGGGEEGLDLCEAPAALMKLAKTPERGAEIPVLLATTEAGLSSGGYWVDGQPLICPTVHKGARCGC